MYGISVSRIESLCDQAMLIYQKTIFTAMEDVENALVAYDREQVRRDMFQKSVEAK